MSGKFNIDDLRQRPGESNEDYQKRIESLSQVAGADDDISSIISNENIAQDQLNILREEITDAVTDSESRDPDDDEV